MFTSSFLAFIIVLGLGWTALAAVALTVLMIRDWHRKQLW